MPRTPADEMVSPGLRSLFTTRTGPSRLADSLLHLGDPILQQWCWEDTQGRLELIIRAFPS